MRKNVVACTAAAVARKNEKDYIEKNVLLTVIILLNSSSRPLIMLSLISIGLYPDYISIFSFKLLFIFSNTI